MAEGTQLKGRLEKEKKGDGRRETRGEKREEEKYKNCTVLVRTSLMVNTNCPYYA